MRFRLITLSLVLAIGGAALAQTKTNTAKLLALAEEIELRQQRNLTLAQAVAKQRFLALSGLDPGGRVWQMREIRNGVPIYTETRNANAAKSVGANRLYPGGGLGLSLTGTGLVLGEWDGGRVRTTHQEFTGRIISGDAEPTSGDHATHVGGTMIASGVNPAAKGMSYQATLRTYGWDNDGAEMAAAAANNSLRLSNHSYGPSTGWGFNEEENVWYWYGDPALSTTEEARFGRYDQTSADWDAIAYNAPFYLIVTAVGNDRGEGPQEQPVNHKVGDGQGGFVDSNAVRPIDGGATGFDTISGGATAKNVLSVGAADDVLNYTGPASVVMSTFSCFGPLDDGRIKPDVVGNGVQVFSTFAGSNTAYGNEDGTSMASPNVCGALGLVVQHYRNTHANADMRAATLKALAIHTAREAGPNPGPDYSFGYGLLDVAAAATVVSQSVSVPERLVQDVYTGQTKTYNLNSAGGELKVTLCWTDPAAPVAPEALDPANVALRNDLDIRITRNGVTTFPWKLNPANPSAAATKGDNNRDNVEQIVIPASTTGTYTLTVSGKAAMVPNGSQAYSLVITGTAVAGNGQLQSVSVNPSTVTGGASATGTVTLTAGAPGGGANVALTDNTSAITVPASVTVNAGATSANFNVATSPVTQTATRQITATYNGTSKVTNLTLNPGVVLTNLTLNPTTVGGGGFTVGTLTLSGAAPTGGAVVNLTDNSGAINTPASKTIAAGATSGQFTATTTAVTATATRVISATYQGVTKSANLTITPSVALVSLVMDPATVQGGDDSNGTVTLSGNAPAGGAVVNLADNTSVINTPPSATIAAGTTSKGFVVTTSAVGATATRQVTATYNGITKTASLTLTP